MKRMTLSYLFIAAFCFIARPGFADSASGDISSDKREISSFSDGRQQTTCYADDKNLYVKMSTRDSEYQMEVMNFGMILEVLKDDTNKKVVRVDYPIIQEVPPPEKGVARRTRFTETEEVMRKKHLERLRDMKIYKGSEPGRIITVNKENNIKVRILSEPHGLIYDARIPLSMIKRKENSKKIKYIICLRTPVIDLVKLKKKFGVPTEDMIDGQVPSEISVFKENEVTIENMDVKVMCLL